MRGTIRSNELGSTGWGKGSKGSTVAALSDACALRVCALTATMSVTQCRVLIASTLGCMLGYANLAIVSFAIFVHPLMERYGWSRGQISTALSIMTLAAVLGSPLGGLLADRYGVRHVSQLSIVPLALSFLALTQLNGRLWLLYVVYGVLALVGAGTMPPIYTRAITASFDRGRGLALSISLTGVGIGAIILPPALHKMIATGGVDSAYRMLALLAVLALIPVSVFLPTDSASPLVPSASREIPVRRDNASHSQFGSFSRIATVSGLLGIFTGATWGNLFPLLVDRGLSSQAATLAMSLLAFALTISRLLTGFALDRFFAPNVAATVLLAVAIGLAIIASGVTWSQLYAGVALIGLGIGAEFDFISYLVGRYCPAQRYGQMFGTAYSIFSIGAALGPFVIGYSFDHFKSDTPALWLLVATTLLAVTVLLGFRQYPSTEFASLDRRIAELPKRAIK